jgi:hypothetical protein
MNPFYTFPHYFPKIHSNIISPSTPRWSFLFRFTDQSSLYMFLNLDTVLNTYICGGRDMSVSEAIGYGLDGWRCIPEAGGRSGSGLTRRPNHWVLEALSPGIKRPGREADHTPPSIVGFFIACIWLRIGTCGGLLWTRWWTFGLRKRQGISWLDEWLLASQDGLSSMELVVRGCIQNFPDWPPAARTANGTALCH